VTALPPRTRTRTPHPAEPELPVLPRLVGVRLVEDAPAAVDRCTVTDGAKPGREGATPTPVDTAAAVGAAQVPAAGAGTLSYLGGGGGGPSQCRTATTAATITAAACRAVVVGQACTAQQRLQDRTVRPTAHAVVQGGAAVSVLRTHALGPPYLPTDRVTERGRDRGRDRGRYTIRLE
jgi:hypothetical protein